VLCATEDHLKEAAYYGPTKWGEMVGHVGECILEESVLDVGSARKLWELSEKATGVSWDVKLNSVRSLEEH